MENSEKILRAMAETGKPARPGEIAEKTGIQKDEVSKIIKKLKSEGKVTSPKRCFYSLPE